jgi:predicted small metal-binding protein
MSQIYEDCERPFLLRCGDVGLDCNFVILGQTEEEVEGLTITHMFEDHAIHPEEMTTCMRLKIRQNIHLNRDLVRAEVCKLQTNY